MVPDTQKESAVHMSLKAMHSTICHIFINGSIGIYHQIHKRVDTNEKKDNYEELVN